MKQIKLKTALRQAKLTQGDVAEAIGISKNAMSNKIQGDNEFLYIEAVKICDLLKVSNPRDLFESEAR